MNIYVGNLSRLTTEETLKRTFEQFGQVTSAKIIFDRETRESRGFAFVEMPVAEEALVAIAKMNDVELDGRKLRVNEAREAERSPRPRFEDRGPRPPRSGNGNGGGNGGGSGGFRNRF
ncbi:RNA-binding protein [Candidatus Dependentiae bacterium]|nr:RNA-binding protein [Candidatus Dependentiae bacterium]